MSADTARTLDNDSQIKHTSPIPINTSAARRRAMSVSSSDSSPNSPPALQTPLTPYTPGFNPSTSPSSSPLLSYFMSTSPTKPAATFPFRRVSGFSGAPPVFEDEEAQDADAPSALHARRATTAWAGNGRASQQQASPPTNPPVPDAQQIQRERGVGVLRRLSLSSGFKQPFLPGANRSNSPPRPSTPPSAVDSTIPIASARTVHRDLSPGSRRVRRATTMNVRSAETKQRRAPSPMGERILKGHFDGFN
ncbi:hypothetical protein BV25DRAFT_1911936 [Artomyces pyxidatus]|uniref:Uncharacterized protein n=1 Tax=Artomyces pyxidatus TaxID=48021 RepID=A0ACB8TFT4_9AGAM|nr:hypothetical protein BV25DRAFT_1911936 [Artomyces pyxidatus]